MQLWFRFANIFKWLPSKNRKMRREKELQQIHKSIFSLFLNTPCDPKDFWKRKNCCSTACLFRNSLPNSSELHSLGLLRTVQNTTISKVDAHYNFKFPCEVVKALFWQTLVKYSYWLGQVYATVGCTHRDTNWPKNFQHSCYATSFNCEQKVVQRMIRFQKFKYRIFS